MATLRDDLSGPEWQRLRNQQLANPNGGIDPTAPIWVLHDKMPPKQWQAVRNAQVDGTAPAARSTAASGDAKRAAARDYGAHHLLDVIPGAEGTSSYDARYNDGAGTGAHYPAGWKRPTELTIDEAIRMAPDMRRSARHYAIGMFQFKPDALADAKRRMNLTGSELLTPSMQQRIARDRLEFRGYSAYLSGALPANKFQTNLAEEWPSMQGAKGARQSDGVRVRDPRMTAADVRAAMERAWREADKITDSYIDAGQRPPDPGRWREPPRPKAPARPR